MAYSLQLLTAARVGASSIGKSCFRLSARAAAVARMSRRRPGCRRLAGGVSFDRRVLRRRRALRAGRIGARSGGAAGTEDEAGRRGRRWRGRLGVGCDPESDERGDRVLESSLGRPGVGAGRCGRSV